ncbi:hypothetical protein MASR2M78_05270 [Treponema sp.]
MPNRGERAYTYAKACGIIGKSFIGSRIARLNSLNRLTDLDRLIFPDSPSELPEKELSFHLERRIAERSAKRIVSIVSSYSDVPKALISLVRAVEVADLKSILSALSSGEQFCPQTIDLGPFSSVAWDAYPELEKMLADSPYAWVPDFKEKANLVQVQSELDKRYYQGLWLDLQELPNSDRDDFINLIAEEITIKNIVWSLRLRFFYKLGGEKLNPYLIDIRQGKVSLADEARKSEAFGLDRREDWKRWKWEKLLNPVVHGEIWNLDPRYVQNAASRYLYKRARILFRRKPFAIDSLACFIKLMQFEEDLLTSIAEGLALGIASKDLLGILELSA